MATQTKTANLNLVLPADDSRNTPWGASDKVQSDALASIDAQLVSAIQSLTFNYAADTGTATAYAAAYAPAPILQAGLALYFKALHANTGTATLAVNGAAAKAITKSGTTVLAGAEISAGQIVHVVYDGTQFQLISQ